MESEYLLRTVFSLLIVVGLIGLIALIFQRYAIDRNILRKGKAKRLRIEEFLYIDGRRKLALIKKDNEEILILLSANSETVISHQARTPAKTKNS